jgi:hypothetical protein
VLRTNEPLRHRRLGDEEGAGDLLGRQSAQRAQRERDLCVQRERRVAAREDELEPFVRNRCVLHLVLGCLGRIEQGGLGGQRSIAADAVDRPVAPGRHEPGARVLGRPVPRPALGRQREGLLGGLLGEVEVPEEADQGCEDSSPLLAEGLLEDQ